MVKKKDLCVCVCRKCQKAALFSCLNGLPLESDTTDVLVATNWVGLGERSCIDVIIRSSSNSELNIFNHRQAQCLAANALEQIKVVVFFKVAVV